MDVLRQASNHIKSGGNSSALTMKYDGSPAMVFGHDPESGKFFVATKSAFNVSPKINYTHEDIEKNHGKVPGLANHMNQALNHLKKTGELKEDPNLVATFAQRQSVVKKEDFDALEKKFS